MALPDAVGSAVDVLQNSVVNALQNIEKQYKIKFEEQEKTISSLHQTFNELKQKYGEDDKQYTVTRFQSQDIDDILDEIEEHELEEHELERGVNATSKRSLQSCEAALTEHEVRLDLHHDKPSILTLTD